MMNYPFTPEGVRDWQDRLYAQPDPVVRQEAEFAFLHFEDWLIQRFSLDESQQAYLRQLDYAHVRFAADGVYFAVRHRLPIILEKPEKPAIKGAKLEELIKQFESADGQGREASFTGQFIVRISY
ncbi:hypothetical protein [Parapedobacter composti]|nr:hypothetical protein [Parapedobacter composti]